MQDWDTRIKNLKNDIQIAREKYVVPFTKKQVKAHESSPNQTVDENNKVSSVQENKVNHQEKLYVNNDPTQSLDAIGNEEGSEISSKDEKIIGDNNEVAATEEAPTVDIDEVVATEEAPTVDINEVAATEEAPTVDIDEVTATEEVPTVDIDEGAATEEVPTVDINEVVATEEAPTVNIDEVAATEESPTVDIDEVVATEEVPTENILEENLQDIGNSSGENQVNKTELELLEERGEDNLSDEEVDRMYELRLLRSQKNMNNELREQEQEELKKADEEIAHLKTLLKPKPKKLPKGYVE